MKALSIVGIMIAALGVFILARGLPYDAERAVLSVGDVEVSANAQRSVPAWLGWVAIIGGVSLIGAGVRGRRPAGRGLVG